MSLTMLCYFREAKLELPRSDMPCGEPRLYALYPHSHPDAVFSLAKVDWSRMTCPAGACGWLVDPNYMPSNLRPRLLGRPFILSRPQTAPLIIFKTLILVLNLWLYLLSYYMSQYKDFLTLPCDLALLERSSPSFSMWETSFFAPTKLNTRLFC